MSREDVRKILLNCLNTEGWKKEFEEQFDQRVKEYDLTEEETETLRKTLQLL